MNVREKLVELIESARYWGSSTSEEIADHLIDNGVAVLAVSVAGATLSEHIRAKKNSRR